MMRAAPQPASFNSFTPRSEIAEFGSMRGGASKPRSFGTPAEWGGGKQPAACSGVFHLAFSLSGAGITITIKD